MAGELRLVPRSAGRVLLLAPADDRRSADEELLRDAGFEVACGACAEDGAAFLAEGLFEAVMEREPRGASIVRAADGEEITRCEGEGWEHALRFALLRAVAIARATAQLRSRVQENEREQQALIAESDALWERRELLDKRAQRGKKLAQLVVHDLKNHLAVVKTNVEYSLYEVDATHPAHGPIAAAASSIDQAFRLATELIAVEQSNDLPDLASARAA